MIASFHVLLLVASLTVMRCSWRGRALQLESGTGMQRLTADILEMHCAMFVLGEAEGPVLPQLSPCLPHSCRSQVGG